MTSIDQLIRDISNIDQDDLLSAWQWRFSQKMTIVMISNIGDLFLKDERGAIFWLIADGGNLNEIASSYDQFQLMLSNE